VHLWSPEKSYVVDLGYRTEEGEFLRVARSNIAEVPRVGPVEADIRQGDTGRTISYKRKSSDTPAQESSGRSEPVARIQMGSESLPRAESTSDPVTAVTEAVWRGNPASVPEPPRDVPMMKSPAVQRADDNTPGAVDATTKASPEAMNFPPGTVDLTALSERRFRLNAPSVVSSHSG
ncbi:MAG: DUF4912 domain-containing protein, partial [Acidobacteriia bacterium]|nr:DUF4912 domain-containing protein [Terriglobia bacterium]